MVKEAGVRKCSKCEQNGHNSRTCNVMKKGVKIFGVTILGKQEQPVKNNILPTSESVVDKNSQVFDCSEGYVGSNGHNESHEKRRGNPWSEKEQRLFLEGLKECGKGNWKGIATKFVTTRTPTQVASQAQKHFQRMYSSNRKRTRRTSVFDTSLKDLIPESRKSSELPFKSSFQEGTPVEIMNHFPQRNNYVAYPPRMTMMKKKYKYPSVRYAYMHFSSSAPILPHLCSIPRQELPLVAPSASNKDSTELDLNIGLPRVYI